MPAGRETYVRVSQPAGRRYIRGVLHASSGNVSAGRGRLCAALGGDGLRQRVVRVEGGGSGGGGGSSDQTNTTVNQPGVSADTIKVGGVASITNPLNAPYGDIFKGVQAYFAMVNKAGGIYGAQARGHVPSATTR